MARALLSYFKSCNHIGNPNCPHRWHPREEQYSAITHLMGVGAAIVGLVLMIVTAYHYHHWHALVGGAVYAIGVIVALGSSALYHAAFDSPLKLKLRTLDHIGVFFLIASGYTPFALVPLYGLFSWYLLAMVWGLFIFGALFKLSRWGNIRWLSISIYLSMGWLLVLVFDPLIHILPGPCIELMILGGAAYTVGILFYLLETVPFMHVVWHFFVLAAVVIHFLAIYFYILPIKVI